MKSVTVHTDFHDAGAQLNRRKKANYVRILANFIPL